MNNTKVKSIYDSLTDIVSYIIAQKYGDINKVKVGTVESVADNKIIVESDDIKYEVLLDISSKTSFTKPEINSLVHFYEINNIYYLLKTNNIDTTDLITSTLNVKANKISVKNDDISLYMILFKLLEAIEKMTVTTPNGPSGTPINVADFTKIKKDLKKIFVEE